MTLKVLLIGDISGRIGRKALAKILPKIKKEHKPDIIIANGENMAHGVGLTEDTVKEVLKTGVDVITGGDHSFDKEKSFSAYDEYPIIRPANFNIDAPGKGYYILNYKSEKILIINLIGRVFMHMDYDCPFRKLDEILAEFNLAEENFSAIIIDMHAEATSEKISLGLYADGRVSAVVGTHTHVMTADHKITKNETAYITDIGMTGLADGVIGVEKEGIIKTFLTQIKNKHQFPETGRAMLNAVLIKIDTKTGKAKSIKPIIEYTQIK